MSDAMPEKLTHDVLMNLFAGCDHPMLVQVVVRKTQRKEHACMDCRQTFSDAEVIELNRKDGIEP